MSSRKSMRGFVILLLFLIGLLMLLFSKVFRKKLTTSELDQLIIKKLIAAGLSQPTAEMWAAVARHESADYTSNLATNHNNFFGMGYGTGKGADYKVTARDGDHDMEFAGYNSPGNGLNDLVLYLQDNRYPKSFATLAELIRFMKSKGYFTDDEARYRNGVVAAKYRAGFTFPVGFGGATSSW